MSMVARLRHVKLWSHLKWFTLKNLFFYKILFHFVNIFVSLNVSLKLEKKITCRIISFCAVLRQRSVLHWNLDINCVANSHVARSFFYDVFFIIVNLASSAACCFALYQRSLISPVIIARANKKLSVNNVVFRHIRCLALQVYMPQVSWKHLTAKVASTCLGMVSLSSDCWYAVRRPVQDGPPIARVTNHPGPRMAWKRRA